MADKTIDLLCVGESMLVLSPGDGGDLATTTSFVPHVGGAESNVAMHVSEQGLTAMWASRLGADSIGDRVLAAISERGVDTGAVTRDAEAPTGIYFKQRDANGRTRVAYYRAGSAASRMSPADVAGWPLERTRIVHLTGIIPALSRSAHEMAEHLITAAHEAGALVSFDVNYRPTLWNVDRASSVLLELARRADIVFTGQDEAESLWGAGDWEQVAALIDGPSQIVIKDDARVAHCIERGENTEVTSVSPSAGVQVVELVGAGDAFAAGYLTGVLRDEPATARLERAHHTAAWTIGGWEDARPGIPALRP